MNTEGHRFQIFFLCVLCASAVRSAGAEPPPDAIVPVFEKAAIEWDKSLEDGTQRGAYRVYDAGHVVEATVDLPPLPKNQRDAKRLSATLTIEPVVVEESGKIRPGDSWTRLGSVYIIRPSPAAGAPPQEIELMRFITGFGGQSTFTQDLTPLAPLLQGKTTVRVFISTYKKPAFNVTLTFNCTAEGAGYRRPVWAAPLFNESSVKAENNKQSATIDVPAGLARPRLRFISTGHATDGRGGDEFITRTHILKIDGVEVARWRPWCEGAGALRSANPMSGRMLIDGRELWSSDLDRSGWRCGEIVEPLLIPAAELTPGRHTIELEIVGIRPKDAKGHGYWRLSAVAVADEPWPPHPEPRQE